MQKNFGENLWRSLTPLFVYYAIVYLVQIIVGVAWGVSHASQFITADNTVMYNELQSALEAFTVEYGLLLQCLGALAALFFLFRMYHKDFYTRRFLFDRTSVTLSSYLMLIPLGFAASIAGNLLLNMIDWTNVSENFAEAETFLFSGPLVIQLIGIVVIVPLCEEVVYRGLIYMRLRQYMDVNLSIMTSAMLFGLLHGNIVQGIYAYVLGILLAYLYEKFGSLKATALTHSCVNAIAMALMIMNVTIVSRTMMLTIGIVALVIAFGIVFLIDRKVDARKIYMDEIRDAD